MARRAPLLLALVAHLATGFACTAPPAEVPVARSAIDLRGEPELTTAIAYVHGRPHLLLAGPALGWPEVRARWFDYGDDPDGTCDLHDEVSVVPLTDGRVYVHWFNGWCWPEAAPTCAVFDPETRRWSAPAAGCIEASACHMHVRARADGWLEIEDACEGFVERRVAWWTPEHGELAG